MHREGRRTIIIASSIGFCSGVDKAVSEVEQLVKAYRPIYTVDSILHNNREMERLKSLGVKILDDTTFGDVVVLPAHGATQEEIEALKKRFKKIVDVTCPFVLRTVNIIKKLKEEGYKIVVVGEKSHRETKVLMETAKEHLLAIISSLEDLNNLKGHYPKVALVSQSTISRALALEVAKFFLSNSFEFRFFDTICPETIKRQEEVEQLAKDVDCVIIVGGKHSSNTNRLFEIARSVNRNTYFIEDKSELANYDLSKCKKILVASGTSTPDYNIAEVVETLQNLP